MERVLPEFTFVPDPGLSRANHPFDPDGGGLTEWLLTNGTGSYAMGTAAGINTRRYHGLLIAAARPPVDRFNLLNTIHESLIIDDQPIELGAAEFHAANGGVCHPKGFRHLRQASRSTAMVWQYAINGLVIEKSLRLLWKQPIGMLTYRLLSDDRPASSPLTLELRPFLAMRDFHHLRSGHRAWFDTRDRVDSRCDTHVICSIPDCPPLYLSSNAASFRHDPAWWDNFRYRKETERQQDDGEDLYVPGVFSCSFNGQREVTLMFGTIPLDLQLATQRDPREQRLTAAVRRVTENLGWPDPDQHSKPTDPARQLAGLVMAADDFVVDRTVDNQPSTTIMAGYPWFSDWGRDTMIALPGCLLVPGHFEEARATLLTFAAHVRDGLIPNRFDDRGGDPHYNTVDAPLWFVHAAMAYLRLSDDRKSWKSHLAQACRAIITGYREGQPADVRMDEDHLIFAGNPWTQLTWMDAARDGVVFTPRWGKAVEINALWHNAVAGLAAIESDRNLAALARRIKRSFNATFWSDELGYLIDHLHPGWENQPPHTDRSLRPNQIFAVSLPHAPLAQAKKKSVMRAVRNNLLTPFGLRTLPESDPAYHPRYDGNMFERDEAYHQGTVWPWLIGHYVEGWLRAHQFSKKSRAHGRTALKSLLAALDHDALGQLHEVYDGSAPQRGQGCPAQAWSVAETLRAMVLIENA